MGKSLVLWSVLLIYDGYALCCEDTVTSSRKKVKSLGRREFKLSNHLRQTSRNPCAPTGADVDGQYLNGHSLRLLNSSTVLRIARHLPLSPSHHLVNILFTWYPCADFIHSYYSFCSVLLSLFCDHCPSSTYISRGNKNIQFESAVLCLCLFVLDWQNYGYYPFRIQGDVCWHFRYRISLSVHT